MSTPYLSPPTRSATTTRRVFISSTFIDLRLHRQKLREELEKMGQFPVVMETFGAQGDGEPATVAREKVASADVFIGVVAWRYGVVPDGTRESITCLEYRQAFGRKPCFIFLASETTEDATAPASIFPPEVRDAEHSEQLRAFRDELLASKVVDFFTTPDDLAAKVAAAMSNYLLEEQRKELVEGPRPPRYLPPRTHFFGREDEIRQLCATLRSGQSIAVAAAVKGMAGVGKSALAAEVLHVLASEQDSFPRGIAYVACEKHTGPLGLAWIYDQLLARWGIALSNSDASLAQSNDHMLEIREHAFRTRLFTPHPGEQADMALVLLDNVEFDLPLDRALDLFASIRIAALITARHDPSLRLRTIPLDVLAPSPSVELFVERFLSKSPGHSSQAHTGEDSDSSSRIKHVAERVSDIEEIVTQLGYLPLAIELAAARAAYSFGNATQFLHELSTDDKFQALRDPTNPERGLLYSFDQSIKLLDDVGRAQFAALGLFERYEFPRAIVERLFIGISQHIDRRSARSGDIDFLLALSLISPVIPDLGTRHSHAPWQRVKIHPLLHEFARRNWRNYSLKTQQAGLLALVHAVSAWLAEQKTGISKLADEEQLIVGVFRAVGETQVGTKSLIQALIQAISNFEPYLRTTGHWRVGIELMELKLKACEDIRDRRGEASALWMLGTLESSLGFSEKAHEYFRRATAVRARDKRPAGQSWLSLGKLASEARHVDEANQYLNRALAIAQRAGDQQLECEALGELGMHAWRLRDEQAASKYIQLARNIAQSNDDHHGQGIALFVRGNIIMTFGNQAEAEPYFRAALGYIRAAHDRQREGEILGRLCLLNVELENWKQAGAYFAEGLGIARELGDRTGEYTLLSFWGEHLDAGDHSKEKAQSLERALAIARELAQPELILDTSSALGHLMMEHSDFKSARPYLSDALTIARHLRERQTATDILARERQTEAYLLTQLGSCNEYLGDWEAAQADWEDVLDLAREATEHPMEAKALGGLGRCSRAQGNNAAARMYFEQRLDALAASNATDPRDVIQTHLDLATLAKLFHETRVAQEHFELARFEAQKVHDQRGERDAYDGLGSLAEENRDKQAAIAYLDHALNLDIALGPSLNTLERLNTLGSLAKDSQQMSEAKHYYEQMHTLAHQLGSLSKEASACEALGQIAEELSDWVQARHYYDRAMNNYRDVRDSAQQAEMLYRLGRVYRNLGDPQTAARYASQAEMLRHNVTQIQLAVSDTRRLIRGDSTGWTQLSRQLAITREVTDRIGECIILCEMGDYLLERGLNERALKAYLDALAVARALRNRSSEAEVLYRLGELETKRKRYETAEYCFARALLALRKSHDRISEGRILAKLGQIALARAYAQEATRYFKQAIRIFKRAGLTAELRAAENGLKEAQKRIARVKAIADSTDITIIPGKR